MRKIKKEERQELIIYNNDFNNVVIKNLTPISYNLLIGLFKYFKDRNEYIFTKDELMNLSFGSSDLKRQDILIEALKNAEKNFLYSAIRIREEKNGILRQTSMILFTRVDAEIKGNEVLSLNIKLNNDARKFFNILSSQYTCVDLIQFKSIRSVYTKTLYRLLSQYKSSGIFRITLEELKAKLEIPSSYLFGNIKQRILEPSVEELNKFFINLGYDIDKKNNYLITFKFQKIKTINQKNKDKAKYISLLQSLKFIDDDKLRSNVLNYAKMEYDNENSI